MREGRLTVDQDDAEFIAIVDRLLALDTLPLAGDPRRFAFMGGRTHSFTRWACSMGMGEPQPAHSAVVRPTCHAVDPQHGHVLIMPWR